MAKQVEYGIKEMKLAPATADGTYPDFDDDGIIIPMIVVDSFTQDKDDDQTTDVNWEDYDEVGLVLPGVKGKTTLNCQTNDLSEETLGYLMGFTKDSGGWLNEGVAFALPTQGMQVTTREIDTFPAEIHQYARVKVEVKKAGTLGKNGLPNLTLKITRLANSDATGKEISGYRKKPVA